MAYSTSNPPILVLQGGTDGAGVAAWSLGGTDAIATVDSSGYITNGGALGMKVGDILRYHRTDTFLIYNYYVKTVSATYPGAVDLSDATASVTATNTD
jgi:hypothetical protein